jgi:ABC-type polysaccharide/polyol phosphate export permease
MIGIILRDIWASRELFLQLTQRDLKLRYRQAIMVFAWALFLPLLTISAGLVLRMAFASSGNGTAPSLGGIAIKSWGWAFFAGAMNFATISLLANASLVTKIYFPREVLPLASIVAQGVDSLIGLAILLLVGFWPPMGFHWSLNLLWMPVLMISLLLLTTGLSFLFACANLFFRDVKYILQVLLTFGIFFTPVLFDPATLPVKYGKWMMINPLAPILEGLRLTLVERASLLDVVYSPKGMLVWSPWFLAYAVTVGIVATLVGMAAFRKSAAYFAEYY